MFPFHTQNHTSLQFVEQNHTSRFVPCLQALAPDLRRKVDANRAARLAREQATNQQANAQVFISVSRFSNTRVERIFRLSSTILMHQNRFGQTDRNDDRPKWLD